MITLNQFEKVFPKGKNNGTAHALLERFEKVRAHRWNHRENILIESYHKAIGRGGLNKSCGSCMATGAEHIIKFAKDNAPKKAKAKKAEPKADFIEGSETPYQNQEVKAETKSEDPSKMKWPALKTYAKEQGINTAGMKKDDILKELNA